MRTAKRLSGKYYLSSDLRKIIHIDMDDIREELENLTDILLTRMMKSKTKGKTLTIKVKYTDFQQITRSRIIHDWITDKDQITKLFEDLIARINIGNGIRLLGLTLSHLNHQAESKKDLSTQLTLEF